MIRPWQIVKSSVESNVTFESSIFGARTDGTNFSIPFNVSANSNRLLIVILTASSGEAASNVKFNSVSMTQEYINTGGGCGGRQQIFYLVNPDSGTHNVTGTRSWNSNYDYIIVEYSGVDQITPFGTEYVVVSGGSGVTSGTVSCLSGEMLFSVFYHDSHPTGFVRGSGISNIGETDVYRFTNYDIREDTSGVFNYTWTNGWNWYSLYANSIRKAS